MNKSYSTICKICNMVDTKFSEYRSGIDWCTDCNSIEQGFIYLVDTLNDLDICEEGNLYDENYEHVGCIINE